MTDRTNAAPLTFDNLLSQLTSSAITNDHALTLLNLHKDTLFAVISFSSSPKSEPKSDDIRYLRYRHVTALFPKPTSEEESSIESLCTHASVSRSEAANVIRDYLHHTLDIPLQQILEKSPDLSNIAPLTALQNFWLTQRRAAFSALCTVLVAASDAHRFCWHVAASAFVKEHGQTLNSSILRAVHQALSSFDDTAVNVSNWLTPPSWYFELFFALTLCNEISVADRESLLSSYKDLVSRKHRFSPHMTSHDARPPSASLDGSAASVLFCAALNHANCIRAVTRSFTRDSAATDTGADADADVDASYTHLDSGDVQRLDALYTACRSSSSPETAILTFSWASLRQLKLQRHYTNLSIEMQDEVEAIFEHMSFAVSSNAFDVLHRFSSDDIELPLLLSPYVYRSLWDDIVAFFCAFPPRDFVPSQVSQMVNLATSVLGGLGERDARSVATALWDAEDSTRSFIGANALLRIASGIFPQTFRPLVNFLMAVTVDDTSAKRALHYLQEGLISVTERSDAYQDDFFVLDEDEGDIVKSISSQRGFDVEVVSKLFEMVCPSGEEIVFVQAGSDIPADTYRPMIARGSIGVANISQTMVTWILHWNGFCAVARILQFLLSVLNDQDQAVLYGEDVLGELSVTAGDSMMLIERLFCSGSSEVASDFLADAELVRVMASIVAEVADPGDRTRSFWLTRSLQEQLLTTASTFLATITYNSSERARYALETFELAKNVFPLRNAVSYLGHGAFPAASAVVQIAIASSRGDVVSPDLRELLSTSHPSERGAEAISAPQFFGKCPVQVADFLTKSALPLWLTSSARDGTYGVSSRPLHWLLPSCALDLFSADPMFLLGSPVLSSVFSVVVTAACDSDRSGGMSDVDTFLFPALRSALFACYMALKERNRLLQSRHQGNSNPSSDMHMEDNRLMDEPSSLEFTLLKPDITYAMALLSSGAAKTVSTDEFFAGFTTPNFKRFVPDCDTDRFWAVCPSSKHRDGSSPAFWRSWVACMSARCLSLQFCCLSQLGQQADAIQVAWPAIQSSSFGNWRGGGDVIRKAYAELIYGENPIALVELLVTVLSCGQRAAARSLMAPRSRLSAESNRSDFASASKENEKSSGDVAANQPANASATRKDEQDKDNTSEIMSAIVSCLRVHQEQWAVEMAHVVSNKVDALDLDTMIEMGKTCLTIAACVRFLRVAWESYNSKWFEACWKDLNVWDLLADLVRCEGSGSKQSGKIDFAKAINFPEVSLDKLEKEARKSCDGCGDWKRIRCQTRDFAVTVDVASCWKGIAADVLQVFSSEIVYKTTANLSALQSQPSKGKDDSADKLPFEVYNEGTFSIFSSVFTEKWMNVLFNPGDNWNQVKLLAQPLQTPSTRLLRRNSKDGEGWRSRMSVEDYSREISNSVGNLLCSGSTLGKKDILRCFNRDGDVATRYGVDYSFDTGAFVRFGRVAGVSAGDIIGLAHNIGRVNLQLTKDDVQAGVVRAFSAMASAVVFADSFCPQPAILLSYSSPQFGGKVCRFLCRFLVYISPSLTTSAHAVAIASEITKLTAALSTRLSADELEQAALTNVRFQSFQLDEEVNSLNSVGQLVFVVDFIMRSIETSSKESVEIHERLEIVQWSLYTAAKLTQGVAFRSRGELMALTKCCVNVLRLAGYDASVVGAASVALSAVLEQRVEGWYSSLESGDIEVIFEAIRALSKSESGNERVRCLEIIANLALIVAQGYCLQGSMDRVTRCFIMRQLSSGLALGLLPSEVDCIPTYAVGAKARNPTHILWCACLRLASVVIQDVPASRMDGGGAGGGMVDGIGEEEVSDVLEFCCASLRRIGRDSLNIGGDWPPMQSEADSNAPRLLTIARVEEAEVAGTLLLKLARYAFQIRSLLPELLGTVVAEMMRYTDQVVRLLRAEPIERWVRPITQREREQSCLYQGERDASGNLTGISGVASPRWSGSPGRGHSAGVVGSPPKRSPMQAVRAAVGDSSGRGSPVPPSPGFTPLSPSSSAPGSGQLPSSSPLSPWIPYGSGLISEMGLYFGEEVTRSLLRGLSAVLATLRRLAIELDEGLFGVSMASTSSSDDRPGLGSLLSILHHAGGELQRGTNDERRGILLAIAENTVMLLVFHVNRFNEQGSLSQSAKDEVRKRIPLYLTRMRRSVPPPPNSSILVALSIDRFWEQLR